MVAIEDGSTLQFWNRCSSTNGILQVVYSTDRTNWTQLGSDITYAASSTWYAQNIDLSSLTPGNYYLGFRTGLASGTHYLDLVIGPDIAAIAPGVPELSDPADEAVDVSVTPTLTWTCASIGGVPTHYNVYCDTSPTPTTLIGTSTTTSFTIETALPYSTTYYWTVTAENATGTSAPAAPRSFTTAPHPVVSTFPWNQDFTSTTFPPIYWNRYSGLYPTDPLIPTTAGWGRGNFANISDPANLSARINIYGTVCKYWLVTPEIVIPAGDYQLCFDLALTRYNSTTAVDPAKQLDDKFIVLIADNPTMANATALKLWDNAGSPFVYNSISNTGESQIVGLGGHTGSRYIAFYGESTSSSGNNGGDNHLFVDNVQVRETPASPIFTYTPDTIDFGEVSYNISSAATNVTVTNTGAGVLSLNASDISIIGANAADFSFGTANLPASLTAGQYVDIPVTVQSTTEGPISATLRIAYGGVNYDVALSANVLPQGNFFIGDGTAYNSNTANPTPYGGYYKNGREQYIVTAAELTALGAQAGLISSIGFNVQNPNTSANLPNFTIRIGTTDATEFANNTFLTGLSEVFSVAAYTPTAGWNGHTLNTPFAWDGVSNLVVQTSYDLFEGSYLRNASCYYTTTPVQRALYYRHDSTAWNTVSTGTPSYDRPNMKLFIAEPVEGMPDVPVLTAPADAATDVAVKPVFTWTAANTGGVPTSYNIYCDGENPPTTQIGTSTTTSFTPAVALPYGSTLYWTVTAVNATGESDKATPRSFTTIPDPTVYIYPFFEGFEEGQTDGVQVGGVWTQLSNNKYWTANSSNTNYERAPRNGSFNATLAWDGDVMLARPFSMQAGKTYDVEVWARQNTTVLTDATVGLYYGTEGTLAAMTNVITSQTGVENGEYQRIFGSFTPTADGVYWIGIYGMVEYDPMYLSMDDITVKVAPDIYAGRLYNALNLNGEYLGAWFTPTQDLYKVPGFDGTTGPVAELNLDLANTHIAAYTAESGIFDLAFVTDHPGTYYLMGFWGGEWHQANFWPLIVQSAAEPGETVLFDINFAAKGDVYIVFTRGFDPTVPVELSQFAATITAQNYVQITWTTQSESNISGYNIYRNTNIDLSSAIKVSDLIEGTNTSEAHTYSYLDQELEQSGTYYYWLQNVELDGYISYHGPVSVTFKVDDEGGTPDIPFVTKLENAYPNPFNPNTNIRYQLKEAGDVKIDIFNARGQLVRSLSRTHDAAGYYQINWDGRDSSGKAVSSGVYQYRMTSGKYHSTKKMVLKK